jgi:hypothetical protein
MLLLLLKNKINVCTATTLLYSPLQPIHFGNLIPRVSHPGKENYVSSSFPFIDRFVAIKCAAACYLYIYMCVYSTMFSIYLSNYQADQRDDGETTHTHTHTQIQIYYRENIE